MPTQKYVQDARLNCKAIKATSSTLDTLQKRSGYSQERFACIIGVTPLIYRRLLACKANPMILLLYSISCRLNIELDQLLGFQPLDTADLGKVQETENIPCAQSTGPGSPWRRRLEPRAPHRQPCCAPGLPRGSSPAARQRRSRHRPARAGGLARPQSRPERHR